MPFKSEAQRRYMYAKHPEIAERWEKKTKDKDLPEKKEGGLARLDRLTAAARKKGVTPRQLGGKTPQQAGIKDPKKVELAKKVKSEGLKQRASETRRGGLLEMADKRRRYAKGKIAMDEDQRIDALLGDLDPIEEVVLKSEDDKIADILEKEGAGLRRFTRQLEGAAKRRARGEPAKKITEDAARTFKKLKHKGRVGVSGERGTQEAYKKMKKLQKQGKIDKEGIGADMAAEAGAAGGNPNPQMGAMPGPEAMGQAPAAPVTPMEDPIDAENEQLKKMIENMELKQKLKEMNTAATGVSGDMAEEMVGMPPADAGVEEDPMNAMRESLSE